MKTALIVDDSRLARAVLRKTLTEYGIGVDEVPSAEAAMDYLKIDRPDVIFLDHLMPGMDGFDALGVLKANPNTATIPVMMYTSQEGQFYVSQARALGAVDVLPKSLAPADVERILRSHHLIGEPERPKIDNHHDLVERFRSMLDEQTAMLRAEFRRELERSQSAVSDRLWMMIEESKPEPPPSLLSRLSPASRVAALAIVVAAALVSFRAGPWFENGDELQLRAVAESGVVAPNAAASPQNLDPTTLEPAAAFTTTGRSWNYTQQYPYDAIPLGDDRAREYETLLSELRDDGFSGAVTVDVHEGRYCINYTAEGSMQLAPDDQPAATCDYIGAPNSGADRAPQSLMFADMVTAATRDGQMTIDTVLHGASQPVVDYPFLDYTVTAGHWNSIADINHRITMRIRSDDPRYRNERLAFLTR